MYILKNALKSVARIKGRSVLIGIVVLIIATSSCVALSIKNSASSLVESYKNENEIESKQEDENEISQNFGMDSGKKLSDMGTNNKQMSSGEIGNMKGSDIRNTFANNTNYVDKINAIINIKTVGELVVIGVVLTLISSSISMVFIARYSPLKILSNRT